MAQHDETEHGSGTMGSAPTQGMFIGNLALVLIAVAILFPAIILINAALHGFS